MPTDLQSQATETDHISSLSYYVHAFIYNYWSPLAFVFSLVLTILALLEVSPC